MLENKKYADAQEEHNFPKTFGDHAIIGKVNVNNKNLLMNGSHNMTTSINCLKQLCDCFCQQKCSSNVFC